MWLYGAVSKKNIVPFQVNLRSRKTLVRGGFAFPIHDVPEASCTLFFLAFYSRS